MGTASRFSDLQPLHRNRRGAPPSQAALRPRELNRIRDVVAGNVNDNVTAFTIAISLCGCRAPEASTGIASQSRPTQCGFACPRIENDSLPGVRKNQR